MATRAKVAIEDNGKIIGSYVHYDGYPGDLGYKLTEHWVDAEKTLKAIKLGSASSWGYFIGIKIDMDDYHNDDLRKYQNIYHGRDRGDENSKAEIYEDEADYLKNGFGSGEEYIYLAKDLGKKWFGKKILSWFYASRGVGFDPLLDEKGDKRIFKPLEEHATREHVKMLTRALESKAS